MATYGYARISKSTQNIERQVRNIKKEYPDAAIIEEIYSGRTQERPKWSRLFTTVKKGDVIIFDDVSRMSRNAGDGVEDYFDLFDRGVSLVFLNNPTINTDVYKGCLNDRIELTNTDEDILFEGVNKYLRVLAKKQIIMAFERCEKEREQLAQYTREGILTARLNGKQIGQKKGAVLNVKKRSEAIEIIKKHSKNFGGSLNDIECMQLCGISRNTYYKYKRAIKEDAGIEEE